MKAIKTKIKDAFVINVPKYDDHRGFFIESFNNRKFNKVVGTNIEFVQDNHSRSSHRILRGLHYQVEHPQGKLIRCVQGIIYDVIVDLRENSITFGEWFGIKLSSPEIQLWAPPGLAHGFYTLSDFAEVIYKTTDYYYPEFERSLIWNDPDLAIDWDIKKDPILSIKDKQGISFNQCMKY